MNRPIIRLKKVELTNFKNIEHGSINIESEQGKASLIGIYGQNGSGKTSFIDATSLIKNLFEGKSLTVTDKEYIMNGKESMELEYSFYIESKKRFNVTYFVEMKVFDDEIIVSKEKVWYKDLDKEDNTKKIIDYDVDYENSVFRPNTNFQSLKKSYEDAEVDLKVIKKLSMKESRSFIFSKDLANILSKCSDSKDLANLNDLVTHLKMYATTNLLIINKNDIGLINMNLLLPLYFEVHEENDIYLGKVGIGLDREEIPVKVYDVVLKIFAQMNVVLGKLVPGLSVELYSFGEQFSEDNELVIPVQLLSVREKSKIPLKYESEGIKKIISILSATIAMYNSESVCLMIDEFDAGIFEYLLGELVTVISEGAKGQFIFTSHNLRPLEVIDKKSIVFTSTNSKNRFVKMAYVKTNHNLRDFYYRTLHLGGQDEELYDVTKKYAIAKAFRKAGRGIRNV